jgi:RHS repeat-associated protein
MGFGFTGELQNSASGMVHLRARWYDANAGRFHARDPFEGWAETPYSQHFYQYAYSNPVNWTDPSGRCVGWLWEDPSCELAWTDPSRWDYAGAGQVVVTGLGVAATVVACVGTAGVACAAGAAGAAGVASWGNRALDSAGMPVAQAATQVDWRGVAVDTAIGAASGPVGYGASRLVSPLTSRLASGALRTTVEGSIVGMASTGSARLLTNLLDGDPNTTLTYGLLESCLIGLGIGGASGRASYEMQQWLRRVFNRAAGSVTPVVHPGLGSLSGRQFRVSARDLALIEQHLSRHDLDDALAVPENIAMMQRLRAAAASGRNITGADASFYFHELTEARLMNQGMSYNDAHQLALDEFGVSNFSVYHPDVINELGTEYFNKNWFRFWGIEP